MSMHGVVSGCMRYPRHGLAQEHGRVHSCASRVDQHDQSADHARPQQRPLRVCLCMDGVAVIRVESYRVVPAHEG